MNDDGTNNELDPEAPPSDGAPSEGQPPAAQAPAEQFVSRAEYERMQAQLGHLMQQNTALLQQGLQQTHQGPAPTAKVYTDDELQELIDSGQGAKAMRIMAQQQAETLVAQRIAPLEQMGVGAIQNLAKRAGTANLKYYERFKDQIDQHIAQMPPGSLLNPDVYAVAHNFVVGQHAETLIREEVEKQVRARLANPGSADPVTGRGRQTAAGVPTPEEMFGAEVAASLHQKGGPDAWAQRMGYADWSDYVTKTEVEGNA